MPKTDKPKALIASREDEQSSLINKTNIRQDNVRSVFSSCYALYSFCSPSPSNTSPAYTNNYGSTGTADKSPQKVCGEKNKLPIPDNSTREQKADKSALEKTEKPHIKKINANSHDIKEQKTIVKLSKDIIIDNFINVDMSKLKLKSSIKTIIEYSLKKILINHQLHSAIFYGEKLADGLKVFLIKEILLSLEEDDKINEGQKEAIYTCRIETAIWDWLGSTNQLQEAEKQFYQLADLIQKKLEQLRPRKKISDKKPSIERFLILESFLKDKEKNKILSHIKLLFAKEIKCRDKIDIINYIAEKLVKDVNNYKGLTRDTTKQEKYKEFLQKIIKDWLAENNTDQYKLLQNTSMFVMQSNHTEFKAAYNNEIKLSTKQQLFVTYFCQEFEKFYCMYKAIDFSLVRRREETVDHGAKVVERYEHAIVNVRDYHIPVGIFGSFIAQILVARKDGDIQKAAARVGWIFGARLMEENARFIRFAAEYIAYRHQMQIELLTTTSIQVVSECAADRAIKFIIASDDNLIVTQQSILSRVWEGMKQSVTYKKYAPMLLPEFKGPISAVIDGVIEGTSEKDRAKSVSTVEGHTWAPGGVFRNVGFMVKDEHNRITLYRHPNLVTFSDSNIDPRKHGALVYGHCWLRPEELELAIKHGYIKDDKTPLDEVFMRFPDPSSSLLLGSLHANPMLRQ